MKSMMKGWIVPALFFCCALSFSGTSCRLTPGHPAILLNQVGFYPGASKRALIKGDRYQRFRVLTHPDAKLAFEGILSSARIWESAMDTVQMADFSGLADTGTFILSVDGLGESHVFRIAPSVHKDLHHALWKAYFYQRSSTSLTTQYGGKWSHETAHRDEQVMVHESAASAGRPAGSIMAAPGGWYDAGDYGKYTNSTTYTTWSMLHLYEAFPDHYQAFQTDFPEQGNQIPDILDEAMWSLGFLLQMQEPDEGFVYHKLTTAKHARRIMPEMDQETRYVIGKSAPGNLGFAAVMAQAARILRPFKPAFADSCLHAAQKAWTWGMAHPEVLYLNNPAGIHTGKARDASITDDQQWAAAELFLTTGDSLYLNSANLLQVKTRKFPSRRNVSMLGLYSLSLHPDRHAYQTDINRLIRRMAAPVIAEARTQSAYGVPIGFAPKQFNWGSNSLVASMGVAAWKAYQLDQDSAALHAAIDALDYILGRNALGQSMVTAFGSRSPQNIHHRWSTADGVAEPIPGWMVGGPQNQLNRDR
ncbi:MAG: glycoside hydrolase family 9 protein, partial [Bacteroidota bacterium]